jgi:hypothetical protein
MHEFRALEVQLWSQAGAFGFVWEWLLHCQPQVLTSISTKWLSSQLLPLLLQLLVSDVCIPIFDMCVQLLLYNQLLCLQVLSTLEHWSATSACHLKLILVSRLYARWLQCSPQGTLSTSSRSTMWWQHGTMAGGSRHASCMLPAEHTHSGYTSPPTERMTHLAGSHATCGCSVSSRMRKQNTCKIARPRSLYVSLSMSVSSSRARARSLSLSISLYTTVLSLSLDL